MPVTRKRKAASPEHSKQSASAGQQSINSYGRVTKIQSVDQSVKKRKVLDAVTITPTAPTPTTRTSHVTQQNQPQPASEIKAEPKESRKRARDVGEEKTTPENKRFKNALPPTPAETPSKKASALFEKLNLAKSPSKPVFNKATDEQEVYDTPPLTPRAFKSLGPSASSTDLPSQLQDYAKLFTALITSTSLFVAHHGLGEPLYLSTLLPQISKHWKKRAVTVLDVQKVLGILDPTTLPFELADNGEGSLCLEIVQNDRNAPGRFDQSDLTSRFQTQLQTLWRNWTGIREMGNRHADAFLEQLPSCPVITSSVAASQNAKVSRGHTLLDDLKSTAKSARAAENLTKNPLPVPTASKSSAALASRGSSLLDRILAKQALASSSSTPSQAQINRFAALDRIPEIVKVLEVLVNGNPRASFGVKSLVENLQTSLRNPLGKEEAERCLELMSGELCPGFVRIVAVGSVRGVVVTKAGRPNEKGLERSLQLARESK